MTLTPHDALVTLVTPVGWQPVPTWPTELPIDKPYVIIRVEIQDPGPEPEFPRTASFIVSPFRYDSYFVGQKVRVLVEALPLVEIPVWLWGTESSLLVKVFRCYLQE